MSRQRDYQPTVDRAQAQAERAAKKISGLRLKADDHHREMLLAIAAARIANEEADALRDRITGLEQSVRDLRSENNSLKKRVGSLAVELCTLHEVRLAEERRSKWNRLRKWLREAMRIGAEA